MNWTLRKAWGGHSQRLSGCRNPVKTCWNWWERQRDKQRRRENMQTCLHTQLYEGRSVKFLDVSWLRRPRGTQGGSLQRYIRITDVACHWGEETQFLEGSSSFTTSEMNELQEDEMSSYIFFLFRVQMCVRWRVYTCVSLWRLTPPLVPIANSQEVLLVLIMPLGFDHDVWMPLIPVTQRPC